MKKTLPLAVAILVVAAYPHFFSTNYYLTIGILIGVRAIVVVGLCLLMGYAGQASLGQAAFYAIGAYTSGILTVRFGLSPWIAMGGGILLACAVAAFIGWPSLKLHGHFLALATLSFGLIVYYLLKQWSGLTGGPSGFLGIPPLSVAGSRLRGSSYYYLVWTVLAAVIWLSRNIVNSRVGRALRAIHDSEIAAGCMGVDTFFLKLRLFILSAAFASLAGSLYAHYIRFFSPTSFGYKISIEFAIMAAVGGMASVFGGPLGVAAVTALIETLRAVVPRLLPAAEAVGALETTVYGIIMVIIFIYMPDGLTGSVSALSRRFRRRPPLQAPQAKEVL